MLVSLFLFVHSPLSGDAHACINGMDKDKKVDSRVVPRSGTDAKEDRKSHKEATKRPKEDIKSPAVQEASTVQKELSETVAPPPKQVQPKTKPAASAVSDAPTPPEKATVSSCSSLGSLDTLWIVALVLPFLARFREH